MENLLIISGVRGYIDENGTAQLNLEDVARGLGFVQAKSGVEYIRWETVHSYLTELSFSQLVGKESFIPESIFYRLAMKARNATAETFQAKVADDILPAIRKHGGYLSETKIEEALLNPDVLIQLATQLKQERAEKALLQIETERQSAVIIEQAPKVEYHDRVISSEGTVLISQIAKDFPISASDINSILKAEGVQYYRGGQWLLKAKYQTRGLTDSRTGVAETGFSYIQTKWTQAGRLFIHRLLAEKGIFPGSIFNLEGRAYLNSVKRSGKPRKKRKKSTGISVSVTVNGVGIG